MDSQVVIYTQAYNAEITIGRAIENILSQNFCGLDPLYIVVNNGSTDSTGEIIDQYARNCSWICPVHFYVYINRPWIPMMSLICRSKGEGWFFQLDADDEYAPDFFESMYGFVLENDLDIAACGVDLVDQTKNVIIDSRSVENDLVIRKDELADMYIHYRRFFMEQWGKIYKLQLVKERHTAMDRGFIRAPITDFDYYIL